MSLQSININNNNLNITDNWLYVKESHFVPKPQIRDDVGASFNVAALG